jgi:DNA polymerase I-like protein with 3'-5' exonuclease and polymerase domains
MIYLIGSAPQSKLYTNGNWDDFVEWAKRLVEFELDVETDVTPYWCNKKLITVQLGFGETQWVLQWSELNDVKRIWLKQYLEDALRLKLIHHAQFEYIILRFHGIEIANVFDTMVAEKILTGGIENANYSLSDLSEKYLGYALDKSEQTTFGDNILTENKVIYAAKDVQILNSIRAKQLPQIKEWNLGRVLELESEVVLSLGEMTYHGMELDLEKWKANEDWARPFVDSSLLRLNQWLLDDPQLNAKAIELGYLSDKDMLLWNLNAPQQKFELMKLLFPDLEGATKLTLKTYIRNHPTLPVNDIVLIQSVMEKDYTALSEKLIAEHKAYLIANGYLIPAGQVKLNWNSVAQALPLLRAVHPKLKDLSTESTDKTTHGVFVDLSEYKDSLKLLTTYGQAFVDKYLEPDGMIRTTYNQIVSTGRLSSKSPNMQNIPAKESVGVRYRNAFICKPNWVYVDSDYVSAELVIIAFISNDPVWNEAIQKGYDIHSVCAELVFGKQWLEGAEDTCAYYAKVNGKQLKEKCKCKQHKTMRTKCKTISFGLAYGMGEMKLAATLKITVPEAASLTAQYFKAFPKIGGILKFLSEFGIKNGFSKTPAPFFRKRWYPFWQMVKFKIPYHLNGVEYDSTLGAIGRQSSNAPIQGCNADITKQALVLMYNWIRQNELQDKIYIVAQIHDQLTSICHESVVDIWKPKMDELMCEAAKVVIPTGILVADTQVTGQIWTK